MQDKNDPERFKLFAPPLQKKLPALGVTSPKCPHPHRTPMVIDHQSEHGDPRVVTENPICR